MDIQTHKSYLLLHDRLPSACGSELRVLINTQPNPRSAHRRRSLHTDCYRQLMSSAAKPTDDAGLEGTEWPLQTDEVSAETRSKLSSTFSDGPTTFMS